MPGFDNNTVYADNVDFRGVSPVAPQITADGDLLIGASLAPHIRKGQLSSIDGSITWTVGAGTISGSVTGGTSVGKTITGDSGGPLLPTAGNWNLIGQTAGATTVFDTIGSGSTMNFENRTWTSKYIVDPTNTVGLRGTYSTLQAAITQAIADGATGDAGVTIYVRNASYNENITISTASVNISIIGTGGKSSYTAGINGNPVYTGSFTNSGTGTIIFNNLDFSSTATITNSSTGVIYLNQCSCNATIVNSNGSLNANNSSFGTHAITLSGGTITAFQCFLSGSTITFSNAGSLGLYFCQMSGSLAGTTSSSLSFNNCYLPFLANSMTGGSFLNFNCSFGPYDYYGNANITYKMNNTTAGNTFQATRTAISYVVVVNQDYYIGVTDTSAPRTITLPQTGLIKNQSFIIKDESGAAGTNNISVVVAGGAKTIDGVASYPINNNYGSIQVIYDGTNYFVF